MVCKALLLHGLFAAVMRDCSRIHTHLPAAGEAVFHMCDVGTKFYIILAGAVGIYIPKGDEPFEPSKEQEQSPTDPRVQQPSWGGLAATEARKVVIDEQGVVQVDGMDMVRELHAGESFGEVALLQTGHRTGVIRLPSTQLA